jgi:DNA-binding LacI/PurR family transcriptional regulator
MALADELARHGVALNDRWVRHDIHPTAQGAGWEEFREIWSASATEKPDGLLVADDVLFRGAATAIRELGIRVPEQLRVVTHANKGVELPREVPAWAMEADADVFAAEMVKLLVAQLRHEPVANPHVVLPLRWVASPEPVPQPVAEEVPV